MREEFREDLNSDASDPMDGTIGQFDEGVECQAKEPEGFDQSQFAKRFCQFLISGDETAIQPTKDYKSMNAKTVALRAIGFLWALDPLLFPGSPSLHLLAKRIGMDVSGLSRISAMATDEFGFRNRAQSHGDGTRGGMTGIPKWVGVKTFCGGTRDNPCGNIFTLKPGDEVRSKTKGAPRIEPCEAFPKGRPAISAKETGMFIFVCPKCLREHAIWEYQIDDGTISNWQTQ